MHPGVAGALRRLLPVVLLLAAGTAGEEVPQPSPEDGTSATASVTATVTVASLWIEEVALPVDPVAGGELVVRVRVRNDRPRTVTASSVTVTAGSAAPVTVAGPVVPAVGAAVVAVPIRPCREGPLPLRVVATAVDATGPRSSPAEEVVLTVLPGPGCATGAPGAAGVIVAPPATSQAGVPDAPARLETPGGPVELAVSAGRLVDLAAVPVAGLPAPPAGWVFPYGAFSFSIEGVPIGGTVELRVAAPGPLGGYGKLTSSGWVLLPPVTATAEAIVVQLTDGGTGDADGRADGRIVDPAAPAVRAPGPPTVEGTPQAEVLGAVEERAVPSPGDGGSLAAILVVLLVALLLGGAGLAVLRVRRGPPVR